MGVAVQIVQTVGSFYGLLIIGYVLMSWFPASGVIGDLRGVLATIVEPYLGLFRRFIPPLGAMDISPIVALLVLHYVIIPLAVRLAAAL